MSKTNGSKTGNTPKPPAQKPSPTPPKKQINEGWAYDGTRDNNVGSAQPYTPRVAPPDKGGKN
nr:MAG TPA: hypothetical protein [Caudoviricetes sp.]